MAVLNFSNKFVCESRERSTYGKHVAAPIFRKSVLVSGNVKRADILICGLGFYELFVNGTRITKGHLAPYISNPDHMICYDYYDMTPLFQEGENVIGIMLGDGFQNEKSRAWDFRENAFNSAPKLALHAEIEDDAGKHILEAGDFQCKKGPVLFNDLRSGVFYDKRLEDVGWKEPGFVEDNTWHLPLMAERPRGKAKLCEAEPIVIKKELHPVEMYPGELVGYEGQGEGAQIVNGESTEEQPPARTGGWIYDFGENNAGIFRLKIKGKKGQRIDIQCAEQVKNKKADYSNWKFFPSGYACPDGYMQRDIYILGSDEEEVFEPMFTYHGYRYLYISGITADQATEDLLTYIVMGSDLEDRGSFWCSDPVANHIYEMGRRSDSSNFYYFPTDCPHREKHGWTNDAGASAEHMILTMGTEKSWRQWLECIRDAQDEFGRLPQIVPTGAWGYEGMNGPCFNGILFILPYLIYRYRGETEVIYENAHAMMAYLEYISRKRNEKGILAIGLGDWMSVDRQPDLYATPLGFSDSVLAYDICRMAAEMFDVAKQELNKEYAEKLGKELYAAVRKEYLDTRTMIIEGECQTAQAMGLYYGIFKENEKAEAFQKLLDIIHRNQDKTDGGSLGLRVIFHVLAQYGEAELAYQMVAGKEFPAYGWYAENGYTTLPEQFVKDKIPWGGSQNHHLFGDVVQWFMRYPAGLWVENYKKVKIKPSFLKKLDFARASHKLPAGEVNVSWKRDKEGILLEVSCPAEVECVIELEERYEKKSSDIFRDGARLNYTQRILAG